MIAGLRRDLAQLIRSVQNLCVIQHSGDESIDEPCRNSMAVSSLLDDHMVRIHDEPVDQARRMAGDKSVSQGSPVRYVPHRHASTILQLLFIGLRKQTYRLIAHYGVTYLRNRELARTRGRAITSGTSPRVESYARSTLAQLFCVDIFT